MGTRTDELEGCAQGSITEPIGVPSEPGKWPISRQNVRAGSAPFLGADSDVSGLLRSSSGLLEGLHEIVQGQEGVSVNFVAGSFPRER
jgi:hypothetical protein